MSIMPSPVFPKPSVPFLFGSALAIALAALLGSLYFSEIAGYLPCNLCWWQRIFMYPLVVILSVALLRRDGFAYRYALPLSLLGTGVAAYHTFIYTLAKYSPQSTLIPCSVNGPSCTTAYIEWFGFISIPLLSLVGFLAITAFLILARNLARANRD